MSSDNSFLIGIAGVIGAIAILTKYIKECNVLYGCLSCHQRINPTPRTQTQVEPIQPVVYLVNDNELNTNDI